MLYILRKTLWMSTDFQTDSKKRRDARERDLKRERERKRSASLSSCFPCSYALCRATNRAMSNRIDFRDQRFSALTDPEHQQK